MRSIAVRATSFAFALAFCCACAASGGGDTADEPRIEPPRPAPPVVATDDASQGGDHVAIQDSSTGVQDAAVPSTDAIAGWIAGEPLPYDEIVDEWYRVAPREVFLVVEKLIASRLALAESARLGIRLDPDMVETEVEAQIARFRADAAAEAPGVPIDRFLREAVGVEPDRYWERIREGVIRQMLAERAVRAWAFSHETAAVRLIVVATDEEARRLADQVADGADFSELAERHSIDESGEQGGLIPFLVRQEHSPLARVAFAATPGEVVGPVEAAGHHFLVRAEAHRPAIVGAWPDLAPAVEESLRAHPVAESEYVHWKLSMERRYAVDLTPLLERIGAPASFAGTGSEPGDR